MKERKRVRSENEIRLFLHIILLSVLLLLCGCGSAGKETGTLPKGEGSPVPSIAGTLNVGDTIIFGSYEQDNDPENGPEPVEWQVLTVRNGRALVISRYALDARPYNNSYINVTWRRSTLRSWLNGEFFESVFNSAEKMHIAEVKNENLKNSCSGTMGGLSTKDRIFLLSIDEANEYFPGDTDRQCEATAYAKARGAYGDENGNVWWWLRSPGRTGQTASIALNVGYVSYPGYSVVDSSNVVRPAFWLIAD